MSTYQIEQNWSDMWTYSQVSQTDFHKSLVAADTGVLTRGVLHAP